MKEKYEKPEIAFVSFELSQNIAAGCSAITNTADYTCPVTIPGWGGETVYTDGVCTYAPNDSTDYNVCYDVPNEFNGVHSS